MALYCSNALPATRWLPPSPLRVTASWPYVAPSDSSKQHSILASMDRPAFTSPSLFLGASTRNGSMRSAPTNEDTTDELDRGEVEEWLVDDRGSVEPRLFRQTATPTDRASHSLSLLKPACGFFVAISKTSDLRLQSLEITSGKAMQQMRRMEMQRA